jgi:PST family polysaccharide transporter
MSVEEAVSGRAMASGITWTLAARFGRRAVTVVGLMVLARLLMPEDFGLVALAASFTMYLETIDDLGTGTALIYWPSDEDDVAQITFGLNVVLGAAWLALTYACAPHVAGFFHSPGAEPVLQGLAWSFPIRALGNTHEALSYRQMRFRARMLPEVGMAAAKASVSVVLALAGFGV